MRMHITRALYAAAAAGITLFTLGFTGTSGPAAAAAPSLGPPVYTTGQAGYASSGRWFRFVATTVTMPQRFVPKADGGGMEIVLYHSQHGGAVRATIGVSPGGGPGTVEWSAPGQPSAGVFALSPKVGDQLAVSIFYDQNGHTIFTATDITQGITKTVRITTGSIVYNAITLFGAANNSPPPPAADTRIWRVADTRQTTYTGTHGTVTGPWQTHPMIATIDGSATGKVVLSPSALWNQDQNFGIWLRAHG
jgi:hypothetical protein